ncbi:MAG: transglutaminase domain-containing protein [Bacteroidota bacterium]
MKIKIALLLFTLLFTLPNVDAQEVKFGKVSKKELEEKFYPQDTSANAVILYKKQRTYFDYDGTEGWILRTEVHTRVKLYNKDGFGFASNKIRLYTSGGKDEVVNIKAYTHNLNGNKIVKTKLERKDVFREETSKNWNSKNFTMPNLKNGSVVEWKYTISSPYFWNIDDVICQYKIPIKELKVKLQIPERFTFKYLPSIYFPVKVNTSMISKTYNFNYRTPEKSGKGGISAKTVSHNGNMKLMENIYTINEKNIPALKEEPYIDNINNYRAMVDFEISAYIPRTGIPEYFNTTWEDVTKKIYESTYFGVQLDKKSHFKEDLENIINGLTSQNEKITAIYNFVKSKIKWNEVNRKYTSKDGIKKAYKEGVGNVAEINLTLVAMLKEAGITANPVLVSTRNHGIPLFPTSDGFNYVIAGIENNNGVILLDATEKYSSANNLPLRALNWKGRLIREHGSSTTVDLYPKSYSAKNVKLSVKLDEEGTIEGLMNTSYSNLRALEYRDTYNVLSEDELISKLEEKNSGIEIEKFRINNKTEVAKPIVEFLFFSKENNADIIGNKIYLSPLLFLTTKENSFKQEERLYPVDFGSAWKKDFTVAIQIPEGYTVESKPEDLAVSMPENLGSFVIKTTVTNKKINVLMQTKINVAKLGPNYYQDLKELFKQAIEKQQEKIILVKTSQP